MITVTAVQSVRRGCEGRIESLMQELTDNITANEPGCAGFDYVRSEDDAQSYLVVEKYDDVAAFNYHRTTPYLQDFIPKMMDCLTGEPSVSVYSDVYASAPVTPSYFHIGVVVPDLEAAMKSYSDALGLRFAEPATFNVPRLEDPDPHPGKLVATFSMTKPPYYELIQADGTGIISDAHCGKILYVGCWEADMAGRLASLRKAGIGVDALFRMDENSTPFAMITAPDPSGLRVEYVDTQDRPPIEEWVRTGRYPGGVGG